MKTLTLETLPLNREPSLWDEWRTSLRLRPLPFIALCIASGGAFGFQIGGSWERSTRATHTPILAILLVAVAFLMLAVFWRGRRSLFSRVACGAFFFLAMSAHAAWRVLPGANDISHLTEKNISRTLPLKAGVLALRGYAADHPQRGEFSTQFPLQCIERGDRSTRLPAQGRVWVSIPPNIEIEVGDAIQVEGELRPLPRATNAGQRESRWRFVLAGCWSELRVKKPENVRRLQAAPRFPVARRIAEVRSAILRHYQNEFARRSTPYPRATAQLLTAMTFGEGGLVEPLPVRLQDDFRIAGMSHILVASGTQISLFLLLLLGLGKVLGLRKGWLLLLVLPTLFFYALVAGSAPSIWRATVIGVCIAWAVLAGRDVDGISLLSLALIVLAIIDPLQLMSLSFQLSFGAAWGLIAFAPGLRRLAQSILGKNTAVDFMAFSTGAQLGVLPILLYHFGRVSLAGIGANFLGVPLAGVLVPTGIAGLVLPLSWLNEFLTRSIVGIATFAAGLPGAQIEQPPVRLLWAMVTYGVFLTAILLMATRPTRELDSDVQSSGESVPPAIAEEFRRWWKNRRSNLPRWQSLLVLAVFAFTLWTGVQFWYAQPQLLRVTMLDVGQGESILVRSPQNRVVLIDGGNVDGGMRSNVGQSVIVPYLQTSGVAKIDVLVITHADADHCNGLLQVLREVPVGLVLDGATGDNMLATEYMELKREILRRKIPLVRAQAGQKLNLGEAVLNVLAPLPPLQTSDNNNAAVLRLDYGETSMLLTADIEKETEERLVRRGSNLKCTILKVGHHGSQTSTSPLFLKAAGPQAAIISCGRYNRFGHPSAGVLTRLNEQKIGVFRTDLDGAIEISSNGKKSWIQTTR